MESVILEVTTGASSAEDSPSPRFVTMAAPTVRPSGLSFEQKERLLLQLEHDHVKYEKELAFKQDLERAKIKLLPEESLLWEGFFFPLKGAQFLCLEK